MTDVDDDPFDVFGNDSDQEDQDNDWSKTCEAGALYLTQFFSSANHNYAQIPLSQRRIGSCTTTTNGGWQEAVERRGMKHYAVPNNEDESTCACWDAVMICTLAEEPSTTTATRLQQQARALRRGLVAGGLLLCVDTSLELCTNPLDERVWHVAGARVVYSCPTRVLAAITKHACLINALSCPWKPSCQKSLQEELNRVQQATISRSACEITSQSRLTESCIHHAVSKLQQYGYCILKSLLDPTTCCAWGKAVCHDFDMASQILLERHDVNLRHPQASTHNPTSYKEMAMREDLRVDLRHGPNLQQLRQDEAQHYSEWNIPEMAAMNHPVITTTRGGLEQSSLRFHPDILEIVKRTMNPQDPQLFRGNWGRYNFDGSGPDGSFAPLRIGPMGGILSLPGSADQAIHADTPHLFEHLKKLPAHYINAFCLGTNNARVGGVLDSDGNYTGSTRVGGTAFLHGSHCLSVSAEFDKSNRETMLERLVRPSLELGDVVLFDCRVLHFGLANTSTNLERPLLYVNMTHAWFHDAKNWDEGQSIFEQE